jgi:hypothetical protein
MTNLEKQLLNALKLAQEHLDYCNYGDSWEQECARESKLSKVIDDAIEKAEEEGK